MSQSHDSTDLSTKFKEIAQELIASNHNHDFQQQQLSILQKQLSEVLNQIRLQNETNEKFQQQQMTKQLHNNDNESKLQHQSQKPYVSQSAFGADENSDEQLIKVITCFEKRKSDWDFKENNNISMMTLKEHIAECFSVHIYWLEYINGITNNKIRVEIFDDIDLHTAFETAQINKHNLEIFVYGYTMTDIPLIQYR
eukprot:396377_1